MHTWKFNTHQQTKKLNLMNASQKSTFVANYFEIKWLILWVLYYNWINLDLV